MLREVLMPKGKPEYARRLDFWATPEQRLLVLSISHLRGDGGKYAPTGRLLLKLGLEKYIGDLSEDERVELEAIKRKVELGDQAS